MHTYVCVHGYRGILPWYTSEDKLRTPGSFSILCEAVFLVAPPGYSLGDLGYRGFSHPLPRTPHGGTAVIGMSCAWLWRGF